MRNFVLGSFVAVGIYHRVRNRETRPTMVSDDGEVAGNGRATIAPNQASRLGFDVQETVGE